MHNHHNRPPVLISLLALALLVQHARAEQVCFRNGFGQVVCENRLSLGARIGIGVGSVILVVLLFACLGMARRRRIQRRNQSYITNPNPNYGQQNYQPQQSYQPQYGSNPYARDQQPTQPGYPPNNGPGVGGGPPGYTSYAPPPGGPPTKETV